MSQICVDTAFPEFTAIFSAVQELMKSAVNKAVSIGDAATEAGRKALSRLSKLQLPNIQLPSMPTPFLPDFTWPSLQSIHMSIEAMSNGLMNFIFFFLKPIMDFVKKFGFNFKFPPMPILGIDLPSLLKISFASLVMMVKVKFNNVLDFLKAIPSINVPLFPSISMPSLEWVEGVQALVKSYYVILVAFAMKVLDAVKSVLSKKPFKFGLKIPTIPKLPTSFNDLLILIGIPNLPNFLKMPNLDLEGFFKKLKVPSFPNFKLSLPDWKMLFPDFMSPAIQIWQLLKLVFLAMVLVIVVLFKIVADILAKFIGFKFPKICVPVF